MIEPPRVVPDTNTVSNLNTTTNTNNSTINSTIINNNNNTISNATNNNNVTNNKDPLDEEFSVKECAVKRSDSKKSTDDETSFTSCTSNSTSSEELTSGLSQDIKLPMAKNLNNMNNILSSTKLADSSLADVSFNDQTTWNATLINFSTPADVNFKTQQVINKTQQQLHQQQQQIQQMQLLQQQQLIQQQQQNLQQLLQAQKVQNPLSSASGYSLGSNNGGNNLVKSQSMTTAAAPVTATPVAAVGAHPPAPPPHPQQTQQQSQVQTLSTPLPPYPQTYSANDLKSISQNGMTKSGQYPANITHSMAEQLIQQSNTYYLNSSQPNLASSQPSSRNGFNKPMIPQQSQSQQHTPLPPHSQPQLLKQQPPQPNQSMAKPQQSSLNSQYASLSQHNMTKPTQPIPILTKQVSMDNSLLKKTNSYYSLSEANNCYIKPPQSAAAILPPTLDTPTLSGPHATQSNSKLTNPSSLDQSSCSKPKAEKARSFSEYKAYLDYLKNGAPQKRFEVQIDSSKVVPDKALPKDLTIVRPYNPNETAMPVSTKPNNSITTLSNANLSNLNTSMNNLSVPSASNMSMKASNMNMNNSINSINLFNSSTANMKQLQYSQQPSFSHHSVQLHHHHHNHSAAVAAAAAAAAAAANQQNAANAAAYLKLNMSNTSSSSTASPFTPKPNALMQPSYSSFGFNQNQNYISNKSKFFPNVPHQQRLLASSYPVTNNIHAGFFQGF